MDNTIRFRFGLSADQGRFIKVRHLIFNNKLTFKLKSGYQFKEKYPFYRSILRKLSDLQAGVSTSSRITLYSCKYLISKETGFDPNGKDLLQL